MTSKLTSDLCKPLPLVLIDQSRISMLDYFIQFMEGEEAIHLVQFWLSVEAFKATPRRPCDPVTSVPCVGGNCEGVGGDCEGVSGDCEGVGGDCEGVRTLDNTTRGASDQAEHTTTVSLSNGVSPLVLCPEQSTADNHMTVTRPGIIATSLSKQVSLCEYVCYDVIMYCIDYIHTTLEWLWRKPGTVLIYLYIALLGFIMFGEVY